jgi:hypothetical protein
MPGEELTLTPSPMDESTGPATGTTTVTLFRITEP